MFTSGLRTLAVREAWNLSDFNQYCSAWRDGSGITDALPVIFAAMDRAMVTRE